MKPKDLKYPFSWEERKPVIIDDVFFLPDYYDDYHSFLFPGWRNIFGNDLPVKLEYCSGNGSWIIEKAAKERNSNWVAVEKKFARARKIWSKRQNFGIANLFIICGEGYLATSRYFPAASVSEVFINFPDPWPKKRHAKHRLINESFISELARALKERGRLSIVTDDQTYSEEIMEAVDKSGCFSSLYPDPFFITDLPGYGSSYFDTLWKSLGKVIRYHQYLKSDHARNKEKKARDS